MFAQRFDARTLKLDGEASVVAQGVQINARFMGGTGAFSVSQTGALIYQTGVIVRSRLSWFDRSGRGAGTLGEPADYLDVALSPDASRLLVSVLNPQIGTRDLLLFDTASGARERVTSGTTDDFAPVWSPDASRIAFTSARDGRIDIYERALEGQGTERKLPSDGSRLGRFAAAWSRGGDLLYIAGGRAVARSDIHVVAVDGGTPRPLLEGAFVETQVRFSPDGRWIAVATNQSDRLEVYVAPFPAGTPKQRVSVGGGAWPRWTRDGREIVFLAPRGTADYTVMAAPITVEGESIRIGIAASLFDVQLRPMGRLDAYPYDVTPDGQRFLFNTFLEEATSTGFTLVVNWPQMVR